MPCLTAPWLRCSRPQGQVQQVRHGQAGGWRWRARGKGGGRRRPRAWKGPRPHIGRPPGAARQASMKQQPVLCIQSRLAVTAACRDVLPAEWPCHCRPMPCVQNSKALKASNALLQGCSRRATGRAPAAATATGRGATNATCATRPRCLLACRARTMLSAWKWHEVASGGHVMSSTLWAVEHLVPVLQLQQLIAAQHCDHPSFAAQPADQCPCPRSRARWTRTGRAWAAASRSWTRRRRLRRAAAASSLRTTTPACARCIPCHIPHQGLRVRMLLVCTEVAAACGSSRRKAVRERRHRH